MQDLEQCPDRAAADLLETRTITNNDKRAGPQNRLPALDMAGWSILDYELAIDGIRRINDAANWLQNQPRSYDDRRAQYHPGADFIVQIGEEWGSAIIDSLIKRLENIRFDDAVDDDRRCRLLLIYCADFGGAGETVPRLMAMIAEQTVKPAAL